MIEIQNYVSNFLRKNEDEAIEFMISGKIGPTLVDPLSWELLPEHLKQENKDEI